MFDLEEKKKIENENKFLMNRFWNEIEDEWEKKILFINVELYEPDPARMRRKYPKHGAVFRAEIFRSLSYHI